MLKKKTNRKELHDNFTTKKLQSTYLLRNIIDG